MSIGSNAHGERRAQRVRSSVELDCSHSFRDEKRLWAESLGEGPSRLGKRCVPACRGKAGTKELDRLCHKGGGEALSLMLPVNPNHADRPNRITLRQEATCRLVVLVPCESLNVLAELHYEKTNQSLTYLQQKHVRIAAIVGIASVICGKIKGRIAVGQLSDTLGALSVPQRSHAMAYHKQPNGAVLPDDSISLESARREPVHDRVVVLPMLPAVVRELLIVCHAAFRTLHALNVTSSPI